MCGSLTVRMPHDLHDLCVPPGADLAVEAFDQVQASAHELPSPSLVAQAVVPEHLARERGNGRDGVADEAPGGVGVHAKQERDEEVVGVPERLE